MQTAAQAVALALAMVQVHGPGPSAPVSALALEPGQVPGPALITGAGARAGAPPKEEDGHRKWQASDFSCAFELRPGLPLVCQAEAAFEHTTSKNPRDGSGQVSEEVKPLIIEKFATIFDARPVGIVNGKWVREHVKAVEVIHSRKSSKVAGAEGVKFWVDSQDSLTDQSNYHGGESSYEVCNYQHHNWHHSCYQEHLNSLELHVRICI